MSDFKENALVVQSNQFVRETSNNLKANEIKMFDVFVSCIDTQNPKNIITITKSELMKTMGDLEDYRYTRDTLHSLFGKTWIEIKEKSTKMHHFIEEVEWFHDVDMLTVEFHKDIMPMLVNLKKNFLTYSVSDLNELKSRYSMLMYKYILSYVRQYKTTEITLKIDEMKDFLNIKGKYNDIRDFEKRILKPIESEINESKTLPYLIRYEKVKRGRTINEIRFVIRPRTSNQETDFMTIDNQLIYEERYNELIKGDTPKEDILNRQADMIIEERK